jgi:predicted phage terminase large subunit-like protein
MMPTPSEYKFILQRDFLSFGERAFYEINPRTRLLMSPHIEVVAAKLEDCRLGKIKRLIINVPPRHLKSHLASIAFPAWFLGHNPSGHVACACYGQELSEKFARDCRAVMLTPWYQRLFRTRLSDRLAVHDFSTTDQGTRIATSVEGPFTGRGADLIIVDDPMKPDDAFSEARRSRVNQWFDNTLFSRLNDKKDGCIIVVMQRVHQDDLVGHLLEQEGWELLSFPAIAQEDETHVIESPLGRRVYQRRTGEVLHPERESLETLSTIRNNTTEYTFTGQYLQRPIPVGGNLVKIEWLKYYTPGEEPAQFTRTVLSCDTANKANELADYSAFTIWGQSGKQFYLLYVCRERLNFPDLKRKVVDLAQRFNATSVVIEDKASGTQLIQDLHGEVHGVVPYAPPPGSDKIIRLHAQSPMFEGGFVLLPSNANWLADYVAEITGFPGTKHDDQVDSTTQALAYMREFDSLNTWMQFAESSQQFLSRLEMALYSRY